MSSSEHLLFVGFDESHWYEGTEVLPIVRVSSDALPIAEYELQRLQAFESGSVGWAVWDERRTYENGPSMSLRRTLVFELENGSWKIVHSHFSALAPSAELLGPDLNRTLSELLESIFADGRQMLGGLSGTATLVFTDIVDSTPLSLQLGAAAWNAAITAHFDSVRQAVEGEGGSVVKTLGDGGMFAFESGSAALRAAIRMQQIVSASSDPKMNMRVGVHTGDVVQTEDDYVGATVAIAARVAAAADGGQILVSSTTAGMVNPTDFHFDTPITVELKGLEGTHQLRPLAWSSIRE